MMMMMMLVLIIVLMISTINALKLPSLKMTKTSSMEVIEPNYNVPLGALGLSGLSFLSSNPLLGVPLAGIGALLTVQAGRVRFQFDDEALEIKVEKKGEKELGNTRENFVVGGKNRWSYKTFTEWYFIPNKAFPVLMYFKETQTKPEGQSHLFPVIMNGKQLYDTMMKKVGPK